MIPVSEIFNGYAREVSTVLKAQGIRVYVDDGDDRMNAKIRNAQKMKVPHMLVLGGEGTRGSRSFGEISRRQAGERSRSRFVCRLSSRTDRLEADIVGTTGG